MSDLERACAGCGDNRACRDVFHNHCPRIVDYNIGFKEDDPEIYEFFEDECEKAEFTIHRYNEDQFVQRYLSSSYSLKKEMRMGMSMRIVFGMCDRFLLSTATVMK